MVDNPQAVAAIYLVAGVAFLGALFVGAVSTIARVIDYRIRGIERPRLLTRDAVVYGGLALSFAQITIVRFLPPEARQALTLGNVAWALTSTLPAVVAVLVYVYFELFVTERAKGEQAAHTDPEPENVS